MIFYSTIFFDSTETYDTSSFHRLVNEFTWFTLRYKDTDSNERNFLWHIGLFHEWLDYDYQADREILHNIGVKAGIENSEQHNSHWKISGAYIPLGDLKKHLECKSLFASALWGIKCCSHYSILYTEVSHAFPNSLFLQSFPLEQGL